MKRFKLNIIIILLIIINLYSQTQPYIIKTNVSEAEIYIDGEYKGITSKNDGSIFIPDMKIGNRKIEVKKFGYKTFKGSIKVTEMGGRKTIVLKKSSVLYNPSSFSNMVALSLSTNIAGADVFINGIKKARTRKDGNISIPVKVGTYIVEIVKNGFYTSKGKYVVGKKSRTINVNLIPFEKESDSSLIIIMIFFSLLFFIIIVIIVFFFNKNNGNEKFGRFKLNGLLGKGGMAIVYNAYDPKNKMQVALKLMDIGLLKDRDLVEKFIREGQAISKINQSFPQAPVVKVFEFGNLGSNPIIPYIVMEKLNGVSLLDEFKKRGRFDQQRALWVIKRISDALYAAHKNGVYHRDVTPDNVLMIKASGREDIRLIDFGVAKHEYTSYKTLDGSIAGKPPYMSPEQCKGQKAGPKSDIYSLGIILFMLLEGKPPFSSTNPLEIMKMHENNSIPKLSISVNKRVKNLMISMLSKNKNERPDAEMVSKRAEKFLQSFKGS